MKEKQFALISLVIGAFAGSNMGKVFKIQGSSISVIVNQVQTGDPAGIALSPDESFLLVSSIQPNTSADQLLLIDLNTGHTGFVTKVVGQNHNDVGGLHASPGQKGIYSWCGRTASGQTGLNTSPGGNPLAANIERQGLVYTIEL